uniref:Secreted protein n=1 Tax=Heterorhabditis bacteriophora TaxID=37862 RepID=A0A1I7X0T9_HETBA
MKRHRSIQLVIVVTFIVKICLIPKFRIFRFFKILPGFCINHKFNSVVLLTLATKPIPKDTFWLNIIKLLSSFLKFFTHR